MSQMLMLAGTAIVLGVVALVILAFSWGQNHGRDHLDLGFSVGYEERSRGWWLWSSYDLYGTIQYTFRGIPIGAPVKHRVLSVKKVDPEAVGRVIEMTTALAIKSPAPMFAQRKARSLARNGHPAQASATMASLVATSASRERQKKK